MTESNSLYRTASFAVGDVVGKVGGDYEFSGVVVSAFRKWVRSLAGPSVGVWRYVVQNRDGILHIYSAVNLIKLERTNEQSLPEN